MQVETKSVNFAMYKYTLIVYIYTIRFSQLQPNAKNTLQREGVDVEHFDLYSTYSEAWNGLLHLLRRELRAVFLRPREFRCL